MENVYRPDLNMAWDDFSMAGDENDFVPSTQLYSPNVCNGGGDENKYARADDCLTQIKLPSPIRSFLAEISNVIQAENGKEKKGRKAHKPSKSSPLSQLECNIPQEQHASLSKKTISNSQPVSLKLFFRSGNWMLKETVTLMEGRAKLLQDMKDGNLAATFKTQDERWESISQYCVQRGVLCSAAQCLFRWDRISSAFKKINDYERHIPSGCDGYWALNPDQRQDLKLPRHFAEDIYKAMVDHVGSNRLINPGDIVYDTLADLLEKDATTPKKGEDKPTIDGDNSSGKKRKRGDNMSILKKELEGTTKQLLDFMEGIDSRREKHEDDIVELTKFEFEEAVALNHKRLALEEESNKALMDIADAFKCFAVHATSRNNPMGD